MLGVDNIISTALLECHVDHNGLRVLWFPSLLKWMLHFRPMQKSQNFCNVYSIVSFIWQLISWLTFTKSMPGVSREVCNRCYRTGPPLKRGHSFIRFAYKATPIKHLRSIVAIDSHSIDLLWQVDRTPFLVIMVASTIELYFLVHLIIKRSNRLQIKKIKKNDDGRPY